MITMIINDHPFIPENYRAMAGPISPAPVVLFESKLYRSLLYESCMDAPEGNLSTLCVSTRFWCQNGWFGVRRGHVEAKFHNFWKWPRINPDALWMHYNHSSWSLDAPTMFPWWFSDDQKIIIFLMLKSAIPIFSSTILRSRPPPGDPRTPDMLFWFPKVRF